MHHPLIPPTDPDRRWSDSRPPEPRPIKRSTLAIIVALLMLAVAAVIVYGALAA